MADYSSLKVAELKAELKKRGIPQTGLRLKQHFIDKLVEEDAKAQPEAEEEAAAVPEPAEEQQQQPAPEPSPAQEPEQPETKEAKQDASSVVDRTQEAEKHEKQPTRQQLGMVVDAQLQQPEQPPVSTNGAADETSEPKVTDNAQAAEPVVQAPSDAGQAPPAEEPETIPAAVSDKLSVPPAVQTSEANTELSTPIPTEETLEDTLKRKRRSQSPAPTAEDLATKKARAEEEGPQVVLKEDEASISGVERATDHPAGEQKEGRPVRQDARFRGLFKPAEPESLRPASPPKEMAPADGDAEPSLHAATDALYIDGIMRPLQPAALRNHLISLASVPGGSPNPGIIQEFYLDPIKTHCFVSFANIAAASRVRSSLHGSVWPNERNRKSLWVDFIPDQQIQDWIRTEEASRNRPGPPVRWEVQYEKTEDGTTATLAEAGPNGSRSAPSRPREPGFNRTPPLGPRGSVSQTDRRPSNVPAPAAPSSRPGQGFKPLDELFQSTTAKPKLYYLPVPRRVADKRLDQFDELLQKGPFPRRGGDEMRRITFEDDDYFVDVGPEYSAQAIRRRQARGGRMGGMRRD
ncbi:hypothetical protein N7510_003055 [Penicillium lagena]|uniref:uncharacterized protein n=1 Tax=Penicillium lagena TaxID=94218 RepID=UPI002542340A|nr:uncharacterized protein N7510_003055 [Penicillium lagena]KAJ5619071.1 hypothetical protein N7510_003055 [Penicillium lagena]